MHSQIKSLCRRFLTLHILLFASWAYGDGFGIGQSLITLHNPKNSHHTITAQLFYPSKKDGPKGVIADGKFPLVIFAHGYQQLYGTYHEFWETLVPQGYIFAFITSQRGLLIDIDEYADDIALLHQVLYSKNKKSKTTVTGHLTDRSALMGHSTGGGAIYLAQTSLPQLSTVVSLAALGKTYGPVSGSAAIDIAKDINSPTLILSGTQDCICPVDIYQQPLYDNTASSKAMVTIVSGDHCGFSDSLLCPIAESLSCSAFSKREVVDQNIQMGITLQIITPWLEHFLKDKPKAWSEFLSNLDSDLVEYQLDRR